jgi:hypothetical protein
VKICVCGAAVQEDGRDHVDPARDTHQPEVAAEGDWVEEPSQGFLAPEDEALL